MGYIKDDIPDSLEEEMRSQHAAVPGEPGPVAGPGEHVPTPRDEQGEGSTPAKIK